MGKEVDGCDFMCSNNQDLRNNPNWQDLTLEQKAERALRSAARGYEIRYAGQCYNVVSLSPALQGDINEPNAEITFCGGAEVSYENGSRYRQAQVTGEVSIANYEFEKINSISITSFMN